MDLNKSVQFRPITVLKSVQFNQASSFAKSIVFKKSVSGSGMAEMKQIKNSVLEIARCARNIAGAAEDIPVDIAILLDENKGV